MQQFSVMVNSHDTIHHVIGFMDDVSFMAKCTSEQITQNAFNCEYKSDTTVNNMFTHGNDKKAVLCTKFPWKLGGWLFECAIFTLHQKKIGNYKICIDKGFPRSGSTYNMLVEPMNTVRRLHPLIRELLLNISNVYTSLH